MGNGHFLSAAGAGRADGRRKAAENPQERMQMAKTLIELRDICKKYDDNVVLDHFNLTVEENEFITLLGPSGCGKTTLLRIVGGFEKPDSGQVFFEGKDITALPPNKRQINTVFQKYALFPHMNVGQNIAFGLKISGKSDSYIREKVKYGLKLVNLEGFENRKIDQMSGGQQQRVAIARAVVNEPKLLLLDEPLGALDLKLREDMQYELIRLKEELGITFLYVTHDQEEALTMSNRIIVLNNGDIQQIGTPEEIYNEPQNAFVADFIGDSNIIDACMVRDKLVRICGTEFPCVDTGFGENQPVDVVIRPEDILIGEPGKGKLDGVVTHNVFIGVHYEMEIEAGGFTWLAQNTTSYEVGTHVSIDVIPFNIQIMHKPVKPEQEALDLEAE
jgi:spermidine/putrescine transport system ATP-binding protein